MNKKKLIISLIAMAIYILMQTYAFSNTATEAVADSAILLCALLCGMPWMPLLAAVSDLIWCVLLGSQGHVMLCAPLRSILITIVPALLSHFTGTNLSGSRDASAGKTILVVFIAALVRLLANHLYVWLVFAVALGGTIDPISMNQIGSMLVSIAAILIITVPLALLLSKSGSKTPVGRKNHFLDDER